MRIDWHSEACQDLQEFDKRIQEHLMGQVSAMEEAPLGDDTSLLSKQGLEIFRLKLKNSRLDHRVFFDLDGDRLFSEKSTVTMLILRNRLRRSSLGSSIFGGKIDVNTLDCFRA